MASDVAVGDSERPHFDVQPADGTTSATLTVHPPTGDPYDMVLSAGGLVDVPDTDPLVQSQRWTADNPVVYDQPGRFVLHWAFAGTGAGVEDVEVYVVASPVAGGPTWTPGRSRVAAYAPHRTLARSVSSGLQSADTYAFTFNSTTLPNGIQLDRIIADGVAWVTARIAAQGATLAAGLVDAAAVCVALYSAAMVERTWPEDGTALQRANDLERRLDLMLKDLVDANNAAGDTGDFGFDIVPMWQSGCYW